MRKKSRFSSRELRLVVAGEAMSSFLEARGGKHTRHLAALWQHWRTVMGDDLADLAFPLGHKDDLLLIGAEDAMAMQELFLQSPEILERANAFMDSDFFRHVKVSLMQGQPDLSRGRPRRPHSRIAPAPPTKPARLGALLDKLNPDSPITRCYQAYLAMFDSLGDR